MKRQTKFWIRGIALCCLAAISPAQAQVTSDGTLSTKVKTTNNRNFTITNGNRAGTNLFHSFEQFSVPPNGEAFFKNTQGIQNIFSRVTGSSDSKIYGTLRANGTANLFLLNPNGIIFGPDAQLDIGGSFLASTASSLKFSDGKEFSAINPQATEPLLKVSTPIGLQFGATVGNIGVETSLDAAPGKTLALVGGNVSLDGGTLRTPGGRVELGGLAEAGTVGLDTDNGNLGLGFPKNIGRADVSLTSGAVDVTGGGGGSIAINAQDLDLLGGSFLQAGLGSSLDGQPNDIRLNVTGAIRVEGSLIYNNMDSEAIGKGGDITIQAKSLSLTDRAKLSTSTYGQAEAGDISVRASKSVSLNNGFISAVNSEGKGKGKGGNVSIETGSFFATGNAQLKTSTSGIGNAGSVTINARDTVSFEQGGVFSDVQEEAEGNAGNIAIKTGSLFLTDSAQLKASTLGKGNAGSVTINARNVIRLENSEAISAQGQVAEGEGGGITISTGKLFLTDGAQLVANTRGKGNAGNITIVARDTIRLEKGEASSEEVGNTGIKASVLKEAKGDGGNIDITTRSLSVKDGTRIATNTFAKGNAGKVTINADTISFDGVGMNERDSFFSGAFSFVAEEAEGNGGTIDITTTGPLFLKNAAQLNASTGGKGNAGSVRINADTISLQGIRKLEGEPISSLIEVSVLKEAEGDAGKIDITTESLSVKDGAQLVVSTRGKGDAGDVIIDADTVSLEGVGGIKASLLKEAEGDAGIIDITTGSLSLKRGARIATNTLAQEGDAGSVTIKADTVSMEGVGKNGFSSGAFSFVGEETKGNGGTITITTTKSFSVKDGALVNAINDASGSQWVGGNIFLTTKTFEALDGGQVLTTTRGPGQAGNINLNATDSVILDGSNPGFFEQFKDYGPKRVFNSGPNSGLDTSATASGDAGSLTINTRQLTVENKAEVSAKTTSGKGGDLSLEGLDSLQVSNGGQISTSTQTGQAGNLSVNAKENAANLVQLSGQGSGLFARATGKDGQGGNLTINTQQLAVQDGAEVSAKTTSGKGGNIRLEGLNSLQVSDGEISASTAMGQAGFLSVNATKSVKLGGKGGLSVEATKGGSAGSLTINTKQLTVEDGAKVSAKTISGKGGNIRLEGLNSLQVSDGEISASTATGQAGRLSVIEAESVDLSSNGVLSVEATDSGTAGDLTIDTEQLTVQDGARVTVSSPTGRAGNLGITANRVYLNNGSLTAETGAKPDEAGKERANINLQDLDLLLLQNGSLISAEAKGDANGGNINIKTAANGFIIATPNQDSDIIANASEGRGGNIAIETQGIFGIKERKRIPGNGTNDIDASSEFGLEGDVTINTPDVDPDRALVDLPEEVVDTSGLIAQGCPAGVGLAASKFVVTGRGGLPPIPRETVSSDTILEDWGKLPLASAQPQDISASSEPSRHREKPDSANRPISSTPSSISAPIVEAQGWVTGPRGEVVLTAQAPTVTPRSSRPSTPDCHRLKTSSNPSN